METLKSTKPPSGFTKRLTISFLRTILAACAGATCYLHIRDIDAHPLWMTWLLLTCSVFMFWYVINEWDDPEP